MLLMLSGCESVSQGSFCAIYLPVYTVPQDTELTKNQVDANNSVWVELCDE
jgi:hypothetical protein